MPCWRCLTAWSRNVADERSDFRAAARDLAATRTDHVRPAWRGGDRFCDSADRFWSAGHHRGFLGPGGGPALYRKRGVGVAAGAALGTARGGTARRSAENRADDCGGAENGRRYGGDIATARSPPRRS